MARTKQRAGRKTKTTYAAIPEGNDRKSFAVGGNLDNFITSGGNEKNVKVLFQGEDATPERFLEQVLLS